MSTGGHDCGLPRVAGVRYEYDVEDAGGECVSMVSEVDSVDEMSEEQ